MNRYEEVTDSVLDALREVRREFFPELVNAKIKVLYDTKKRVHAGKIVLACILKPNDLIKHLTTDEKVGLEEGYDYIIVLDKLCWENSYVLDRERILRHELRHTFFDIEAENNPYKLIDHDITDFYAEVELNAADPRWHQRLASLTADIYEQKKDEAKDAKKRGKKGRRGRGFFQDNVTPLRPDQKTPIEEEAEKGGETGEEEEEEQEE